MVAPLQVRPPLSATDACAWRRFAIFSGCKWDPQVGDTPALADFPLVLAGSVWGELAASAENLARETEELEQAILHNPRALTQLGLPRALRRVLRLGPPSPAAFRIMRFDFHPTADGWAVTEVNSDVPGGFVESSEVARWIADRHPDCLLPGDPVQAIVSAFQRRFRPGATVGLIHATAYTDDRQCMVLLARRLSAAGLTPLLLSPDNLGWEDGRCHSVADWCRGPLDALFRFFPAEWLPNLPRCSGWQRHFTGSATPAANPAWAIVSQSKRLALAAHALGRWPSEWRRLHPETCDPRRIPTEDTAWVLKPALGRVGEDIGLAGVTPDKQHRRIRRQARWSPREWAAQRRFAALPIATPQGPRFPCLGIYVIDGRAAGVYGRVAALPLVDANAQDIAVLIDPST